MHSGRKSVYSVHFNIKVIYFECEFILFGWSERKKVGVSVHIEYWPKLAKRLNAVDLESFNQKLTKTP